MTGLTVKQFNGLIDAFGQHYEKAIDADRLKRGWVCKTVLYAFHAVQYVSVLCLKS